MLVICHFNIKLAEAGVVRVAGYVDSYLEHLVPLLIWILTCCPFYIIWEVLLAYARWFLTSWGTYIFIMHAYIYLFYFINWGGWRCWWTDFVPEAIHNPVATKLLVSGLLTRFIYCVRLFLHRYICLFVFNVPSTARSFRDGTPIYCPLRRTWSSVNTPSRPGIEPGAVAWQFITLPLRYGRSWHRYSFCIYILYVPC